MHVTVQGLERGSAFGGWGTNRLATSARTSTDYDVDLDNLLESLSQDAACCLI